MLLINQLNLSFGSHPVLDGIDLSVQKNQVVGLIGPNGAGKSSLIHCLLKKYKPANACIRLNDQDLNQLSQKQLAKQIAFVLQHQDDEFGINVLDAIQMGRYPHQNWSNQDQGLSQGLLEKVIEPLGLAPLLHKNLQCLSGGEQQRVHIARALMQDTPLIVLDEPTNHLDIHFQIDMMQQLKRFDKSILCSLHDLNLAAQFCDQIYLLSQGKVVASGTPWQVLSEENIKRYYLVDCLVDKHPKLDCPRITY